MFKSFLYSITISSLFSGMRRVCLLSILSVLIASCDFKTSADYNAEAEKYEKEERYEEAIVLLDKALEKDPSNIHALINRAVDKVFLEDFKGAIEDYTRIISIDPDNGLAFMNRGKNKGRLKDYSGALDDFEKAIKTKGGEHIYLNKFENPYVDTGFEFDVDMEEIRLERAIVRYNIDSLKLAFDDFTFCINQDYKKPMALYWRGTIYVAYNMIDEGCKDFNESKAIGFIDAKEMIDKYCALAETE